MFQHCTVTHSQSHFHDKEKTRQTFGASSVSPHPVSALLAGPGLALWPVEGPALPLLHRVALLPAHSLVLSPALCLLRALPWLGPALLLVLGGAHLVLDTGTHLLLHILYLKLISACHLYPPT